MAKPPNILNEPEYYNNKSYVFRHRPCSISHAIARQLIACPKNYLHLEHIYHSKVAWSPSHQMELYILLTFRQLLNYRCDPNIQIDIIFRTSKDRVQKRQSKHLKCHWGLQHQCVTLFWVGYFKAWSRVLWGAEPELFQWRSGQRPRIALFLNFLT